VSGTYYLMPWVDPFGTLLENTFTDNVNPDDPNEINNDNYKARAIDLIGTPPPPPAPRADVQVTSVAPQPSGVGGEAFTVSWTVQNIGEGAANAGWFDSVYLSDQPTRTATAHLFPLGSFLRPQTLALR